MATIDKKQKRWYAESTFESLDKTTIPIGTEIQVSGKLGQADFDEDTNTKLNAINGKLTAPTDEITVDSVPVISSTGTVSAQPFKKYYKHLIGIVDLDNRLDCYITVISSKSDAYTLETLETSASNPNILWLSPVAFFGGTDNVFIGQFWGYTQSMRELSFALPNSTTSFTLTNNASISDTIMEL